jgi:hypothetical protein
LRCGFALVLFISLPCWTQTTTTPGQANANAPCSVADTGSGNKIQINCGIGKEQGQKMLAILNKILAKQLDPDAVMAKLDEILHTVNPNALKITYTFNGSKRVTSPGRNLFFAGEASKEFRQMGALEQGKEWLALLKLAQSEINTRPEWFTPYIFAGEAQLKLGHRPEALELLEAADKGIAGNPDYDPLMKPLAQMLQELREH